MPLLFSLVSSPAVGRLDAMPCGDRVGAAEHREVHQVDVSGIARVDAPCRP
jgi:hypothetical protein